MKQGKEGRRDPKKEGSKGGISEMMVVLISFTMEIISQCICISNHPSVHFKYLTILYVNYTSIKLKF